MATYPLQFVGGKVYQNLLAVLRLVHDAGLRLGKPITDAELDGKVVELKAVKDTEFKVGCHFRVSFAPRCPPDRFLLLSCGQRVARLRRLASVVGGKCRVLRAREKRWAAQSALLCPGSTCCDVKRIRKTYHVIFVARCFSSFSPSSLSHTLSFLNPLHLYVGFHSASPEQFSRRFISFGWVLPFEPHSIRSFT
jgi:hypothetical protein